MILSADVDEREDHYPDIFQFLSKIDALKVGTHSFLTTTELPIDEIAEGIRHHLKIKNGDMLFVFPVGGQARYVTNGLVANELIKRLGDGTDLRREIPRPPRTTE